MESCCTYTAGNKRITNHESDMYEANQDSCVIVTPPCGVGSRTDHDSQLGSFRLCIDVEARPEYFVRVDMVQRESLVEMLAAGSSEQGSVVNRGNFTQYTLVA